MPKAEKEQAEPIDAAVLDPAVATPGPILSDESVIAPGANGWRGVAANWYGLIASVVVHSLVVLWAVGSLALADKFSEDEVIPVTLVPAETSPPVPEEDPLEFEMPELPTPEDGLSPPSQSESPEDVEAAEVPASGNQQFDEFSEALATFGMAAFDRPTTLSEDELGSLSAQAKRCWEIPEGWADAGQVSVTVRFLLNRDGSLNGEPAVVEFPASVLGKAAADNAIRAVIQCGPFKMPQDKYDQWNDVQLRFEP